MQVLGEGSPAAFLHQFCGLCPPAILSLVACVGVPAYGELEAFRPGLGVYDALAQHFAGQILEGRTMLPAGVVVDRLEA